MKALQAVKIAVEAFLEISEAQEELATAEAVLAEKKSLPVTLNEYYEKIRQKREKLATAKKKIKDLLATLEKEAKFSP